MNKVHARMIQKLVHTNNLLRRQCEELEEALEEAEEEIHRLKEESARCVIALIQSAGDEFMDTPMTPDVHNAVMGWLNSLGHDPSTMTDEQENEIWEDINSIDWSENEEDDTYYSPTNRISHLFDDEEEV